MSFRNLIIGIRNIRKNGIYSLINIAGLALGIAVVVLILFWVVDELNYDKFHKNADRIYTVYEHQEYSEGQDLFTFCTPFPLSEYLVTKYPEIKKATTFTNFGKQLLRHGDKEFKAGNIYFADSNFLKVFTYPLIEGDNDALKSPDKIIITQELAHLFFGNEPALGKTLKFNDGASFTVGAVLADQKENTTLDFKVLMPIGFLHTSMDVDLSSWDNNWPRTCVVMSDKKEVEEFSTKIAGLCKDNGQPNTTLHMFPFTSERLYSYSGRNNRIQYVYQFIGIALIIILIASINFINLSTAKAEQRRPEVGVRKALGAGKFDIFKQFIFEKGLMILMSLILSSILVSFFMPLFNFVSDKHITIGLMKNGIMIFMILMVIIIVMLVSVMYPSFYLASFNPILAMRNRGNKAGAGLNLRNLLVVIQFVLSVILISGTIAITKQIRYINNYDLGYDQANLVYLPLNGEARNKYEILTQELKKIPGIQQMSLTNNLPFYGTSSSWGFNWEGKDPENKVLISQIQVDRNYFKTMGIKFSDGTTFSDMYDKIVKAEDISMPQVILNEEAIRRMKMENPLGKTFGIFNDKKGIIVGVINNFHFQSLHSGVEPLLVTPLTGYPDNIIIRISPGSFSKTIDEIKKTWTKILPQTTCEVGFFEDSLEKLYTAEQRISGLFKYFSFVAIFISCIGLFGLSLFVIERRRKEIGVRKVNGARTAEVMILLNKDFIKWVIIAFIIACPAAWFTMHKWLENFAYKTALSWWIFALAGMLALGIALLTVSWQSFRAATKNPVEALRYE